MANLANISYDKIENDIMSILYANIDTIYTQHDLYNKLLKDKYEDSNYIDPSFKYKFLLILRNLRSKYDDVILNKENNFYSVYVKSNQENVKSNQENVKLNNEQFTNIVFFNDTDITEMYNYIYDNKLTEHLKWIDPINGNSIYHELVLNGNINIINKLIDLDEFDYFVKNNSEQTPFQLSMSIETKNVLIMGLLKKIKLLTEKLAEEQERSSSKYKLLQDKNEYLESNEYNKQIIINTRINDIVKLKLNKLLNYLIVPITVLLFYIVYFSILLQIFKILNRIINVNE